jgi:hypothetical protein
MDVKAKWVSRSAGAKAKGPAPEIVEAGHDDGKDGPPAPHHDGEHRPAPGAVAVHGPGCRRNSGDASDEDAGDEATDAPLQVDSYAVQDEGATDEEIRRRILASTERAELVSLPDRKPRRYWPVGIVLVVVIAVVIGVAVPLSTRSKVSSQAEDDDVLASVEYMEWGSGVVSIRATTRHNPAMDGGLITSGVLENTNCKPKPCTESDENCALDVTYKPGCCVGANCTNETKCGDRCPDDACRLTDPSNTTCATSGCFTCEEVNGDAGYVLNDFAFSIDCLEVGTAIRPENGQTYQWAIVCGPVITGPKVEENRDYGEYQCASLRSGANYSHSNGGVIGSTLPCQFIALAECGCGPDDIYTFGLPAPTGPCLPDGDCAFLCEDASAIHARNLCRAFPGNISWWEGTNVLQTPFLYETGVPSDFRLEIYIKNGPV